MRYLKLYEGELNEGETSLRDVLSTFAPFGKSMTTNRAKPIIEEIRKSLEDSKGKSSTEKVKLENQLYSTLEKKHKFPVADYNLDFVKYVTKKISKGEL